MRSLTSRPPAIETLFLHEENSPCNGVENISIIVHKRRLHHHNKRKKVEHTPKENIVMSTGSSKYNSKLPKKSSMPEFRNDFRKVKLKRSGSDTMVKKFHHPYNSKFFVNVVSELQHPECLNPFRMPIAQVKWRVYRCQLSTQDESCCCSCNSDAMFEVMKSLYDCYKKKNCDHCNCILCGHMPREERKLGELRKSGTALSSVVVETDKQKAEKRRKLNLTKKSVKAMAGKSPAEKENILKELAMTGVPLPEGKTASEKELIKKVKTELGLPPEPKTAIEKEKFKKAEAAGIVTPLEGKSATQKEKIVEQQVKAGISLPEGRTASEKALIQKVKTAMAVPSKTKVPSEKLRKAKAAGFLTPLEGKSPEQKENIIKGLAMSGVPLPEGKTASEKKLIEKVRTELGLPPEPKSSAEKKNYQQAFASGIVTPLEGKSKSQKKKILKSQAEAGLTLPEGRTASEKSLIAKVKATTKPPAEGALSLKKLKGSPSEKFRKAKAAGLLTPLEGKSAEKKEKLLRGLAMQDIPLPEGKTVSEKKLIEKVRADVGLPPEPKTASDKEKYEKAAAAGFITPLEGKSQPDKEKILKGQLKMGIPLPVGRTASENALIQKVKAASGERKISKSRAVAAGGPALPPDKAKKLDQKTAKVMKEGKGPSDECICGLLTPESERVSIGKTVAKKPTSERGRAAEAAGILTPLTGKSPEQREKILKDLAKQSIPLPEGKTASEKKIIAKVRADLGLPPEPKTPSIKEKYAKAQAQGIITPLEGKSHSQKEKILKAQADAGLPLPEGRTASEKALINKVKAAVSAPSVGKVTSEKFRKAKAAGLLTPLAGKSPEQRERILKGLAMQGIPLPEGKTASENKMINKVRTDLGMPPKPKTPSMKEKYAKAEAQGIITPLEGKSPSEKEKILKAQVNAGLPLPEGRTASEKALINKFKAREGVPSVQKVTSEKLRKAKAAGLLTPLVGKSPEQKEKILKGLAMHGIPLPQGKTASENKIIDKVRTDLGMPPEPKTPTEKEKYAKAHAQGIIIPLEGKSPSEKEKILKGQLEMGLPLPVGRTASEKALIQKVKAASGERKKTKSRAVAASGPALPPDKAKKLDQKTAKIMKEGKGPSDECICGLLTPESERVSIGKTVSKKPTSERMRAAKAAGLLTPLTGKSPEQREKILKGLAKQSIPLPEGKTASEKKIIAKVRADLGLPPEPKTPSIKEKYAKAQAQGIITPLEGKSHSQKEKILKAQADAGLPLPEGRTASEKALINKVKAAVSAPSVGKVTSEKLRKAKAAGLLTPLEGKTRAQKEKILQGRVAAGLPFPEGKTSSDIDLIKRVKAETGYVSPVGKTPSEKLRKAKAAGLLTPLEGKTLAQKEKILRGLTQHGVPLPEGKTPSEKALIQKIKTEATVPSKIPSEKLREAKAAGLLTPLEGKSKDQKEKILKGLVKAHLPLPEGKTSSDQELIRKVRDAMGLPPEPKTPSIKEKYKKALLAGVITPLEGKTPAQKEKVLKKMQEAGVPLPEGRTPSEKSIVRKVKATARPPPSKIKVPSEKMRAAKAAGLLTPLENKTPAQKEKILKGLAKSGIPLPEGKTASEKEIIRKVIKDMGLPPEPKSPSVKERIHKAQAAGIVTPLEGKTQSQKEKILRNLALAGVPLPEGRTASEKALISKTQAELAKKPSKKVAGPPTPLSKEAKILDQKTGKVMKEGKGPSDECICEILTPESEKVSVKPGRPSVAKAAGKIPSEKLRKAKAAGLLTPLEGKSPAQKEKIIRGLAMQGLPLPEGRTSSEKKLINKVRTDLGVSPKPKSGSAKVAYDNAIADGFILPLEGKSPSEKEMILRAIANRGIALPEGRTPSEKVLIAKVKAESRGIPSDRIPSEKLHKAKAAGLLTPLQGKSVAQKEKILKGLAEAGIPLPEGKTTSEKQMIKKIRTAAGLPPEATPSEKLGKIRTKSKKIGAAASKRIARGIGGSGIAKAGIVEEFDDVLKTTTCDRGCGCDKKKIRFKHSYVKIRVTSPDISSLCPCPDECVPGVKGGVLVDNEGIKVTVGSALGFTSFSIENESKICYHNDIFFSTNSSETNLNVLKKANPVSETKGSDDFKIEFMNLNYSNESLSICAKPSIINKENIHNDYVNELETKSILWRTSTSRYLIVCSESSTPTSEFPSSFQDTFYDVTSNSSLDSIEIVKTESSLSFLTTSSASIRTISIISFHNSSITSRSSHYLCYQYSNSANSINAEDSEYFTNVIDYSAMDSLASQSDEDIKYPLPVEKVISVSKPSNREVVINNPCVFRISHTNICNSYVNTTPRARKDSRKSNDTKHNPIIVINELSNDEDVIQMVDEILAKKEIANASSIFVVVPTYSDEYDTDLTDSASSTICIRISQNFFDWKNSLANKTNTSKRSSSNAPVAQGLKISAGGKQYFKVLDKQSRNKPTETIFERTDNKDCQVENTVEFSTKHSRAVSIDTTEDRPCCCSPKEPDTPENNGSNDQFVANAYSELITPMLVNQGVAQGLSEDAYHNVPRLNIKDYKSILSPNQTLSVSLCYIPPCTSSSPDCHEITKPPVLRNAMGTQYQQHPELSGLQSISPCKPSCWCGLGKVQGAIAQPVPKKYHSIGCGPAQCKAQTISVSAGSGPAPSVHANQGNAEEACGRCGQPSVRDGRKVSCLCSGKEKKTQFPSLCPCEGHKPPLVSTAIGPDRLQTRSIGGQNTQNTNATINQSPCACKDNSKKGKKKKNIICECPQMEEDSIEEFLSDFFDERENRKMKSDQTQTISGFKFNVKKREEEMSFEDALKYFEENPIEGYSTQVDDSCFCDLKGMPTRKTTGSADCECPYDSLSAQTGTPLPEETLPGFKIHIEGKGSGSKGLSGICCFDMVQESNGLLLLHD